MHTALVPHTQNGRNLSAPQMQMTDDHTQGMWSTVHPRQRRTKHCRPATWLNSQTMLKVRSQSPGQAQRTEVPELLQGWDW